MKRITPARSRGFTLIEMAVVVGVIVLLLSSILVPLATQVEERRIADTRRMLDDAREALIGFVVANGRLPCPASTSSNGNEHFAGPNNCNNYYNGFLPAATLGLTPTDAQGFLIDPWGNRIRYAVTAWVGTCLATPPFITPNGISACFVAGAFASSPDLLQVCSTGGGVGGPPPVCAPGSVLTRIAPAVVYSTGPNALSGGTSTDEAENPNANSANNDRLFVSRAPGSVGAAGGVFDDIVTWVSPNVLFSRMVAAGKLP
jgi:prepilin-type N-terminal cleavage/methylation domain-containing protein